MVKLYNWSSNCLFYSFYGVGILTLNSLEEHLPSGVVFTYSEQKLIGHDTVAHSVGRAASDRGSVVSVVANVFFSEQLGWSYNGNSYLLCPWAILFLQTSWNWFHFYSIRTEKLLHGRVIMSLLRHDILSRSDNFKFSFFDDVYKIWFVSLRINIVISQELFFREKVL